MHKRDLLFPGILTLKGLGITAALHMNSWSVLYKRHGLWDNGVGCGKALTLGESRLVPDGRNQLCLKGTHCPGSRLCGSHHVMCLPPSSFKILYKTVTENILSSCPCWGPSHAGWCCVRILVPQLVPAPGQRRATAVFLHVLPVWRA